MKRTIAVLVGSAATHRVAETFYDLVMPLLVLQATGSVLLMSLMYALGYVAELLVSLFGGTLVDLISRRYLLITIAAAEATVIGAAATAQITGALSVPLIIAFAFTIDALVRLYGVADAATLGRLVPRRDLPRANGYLQMGLSTAQAVGPALAGVCIAMFSLTGGLWVTATAFVALLGLVFLIRWPAAAEAKRTTATTVRSFVAYSVDGLRYTFQHPLYRALLIWRGVFDFCVGAAFLMLIFYFQQQRHLSSQEIGIIMTCGALGGIVGGAAFSRIQARFRSGLLLSYAALAMAAAIALMAMVGAWPLLGGLLAAMMFHGALVGRLTVMLFQSSVPEDRLGRVLAASQLLTTAAGPASVLLAGLASARYGAGSVFLTSAAVIVLLVFASLRTRIGRADWSISAAPAAPAMA